jgi:hypothetical protein
VTNRHRRSAYYSKFSGGGISRGSLRFQWLCNRFFKVVAVELLLSGSRSRIGVTKDRLQEVVMRVRFAVRASLAAVAAVSLIGGVASATIGHSGGLAVPRDLPNAMPALILAQNLTSPFSLPEMPEPPVSPINPGTLPGTTSAIGGSATGTNPITGLPCNGSGSISVSGAGGLPGTATPPPGLNETLGQIPVGTPPFTSIYGSQSNLGSC